MKNIVKTLSAEAVTRSYLKKVFLEISQNSLESTCDLACNFIKKETLTQVFSCELCEISKNTFPYRTPPGDCFCICARVTA